MSTGSGITPEERLTADLPVPPHCPSMELLTEDEAIRAYELNTRRNYPNLADDHAIGVREVAQAQLAKDQEHEDMVAEGMEDALGEAVKVARQDVVKWLEANSDPRNASGIAVVFQISWDKWQAQKKAWGIPSPTEDEP